MYLTLSHSFAFGLRTFMGTHSANHRKSGGKNSARKHFD